MQADVHFAKGERFEQAQAKLAPTTDWELAIEGCYYAAFQFILAGTEWRTVRHSDNHPHAEAVKLLTQAGAPCEDDCRGAFSMECAGNSASWARVREAD